MKKPTLIVNFIGGPCSGKSTMAHSLMGELKFYGINVEFADEYAKTLVYEQRYETFKNQIYLFGKQHHRIFNLLGKTDVIVTDSPILLSPIYDKEKRKSLVDLVLHEYQKVPNQYNVFVNRTKKLFLKEGRIHNEKSSKKIDKDVKSFLDNNKISYHEMECSKANVQHIVKVVMEQLGITNSF